MTKPNLSQKALIEIRKKKASQPHNSQTKASPLIQALRQKCGRPEIPITNPNPNIPDKFKKTPNRK